MRHVRLRFRQPTRAAVRRVVAGAAVGVLLWVPVPAVAHSPAPDHACTEPARPADEQDDARWQAFLAAVDAYRACISGYATAQREAARAHGAAANRAVAAWNDFVRRELNVPEDFPWPPVDG
jgi:hypothetical protein